VATEGKRFHSLERFPSGLSLTPREKDSDAERLSQKGCCAFIMHSGLFAFKNPHGQIGNSPWGGEEGFTCLRCESN